MLYDQANADEDGYFRNVPLGLRRSPLIGRARPVRRRSPKRAVEPARPAVPLGRRRDRGYFAPMFVLIVSIVGLAWVAYAHYGTDVGEPPQPTQAAPIPTPAVSVTTALFIQTDGAGSTVSFTALSLLPDDGASVVFIPAATMVEVPGFGLEQLRAAGSFGGLDLARLTVENLFAIRFDHVVELTPGTLSELTRTLDPLLVDNPSRIDTVNDQGRVELIYPKGSMLLASRDTADFLTRHSPEQSDLDRLVRHQSFWIAYLTARSEGISDDGDGATSRNFFLDELAVRRQSIEYRILDVQVLGGEDEIYGVDRDALPAIVNSLAPSRDPNVGPISVQLLNGVGIPGLAPGVAERLVDAGATVQLVDNATRFDHEITQIVYYRDEHFDSAVEIRNALETGELVKAVTPIDVVDVTVVVGADLASSIMSSIAEVVSLSRAEVEFGGVSGQNELSDQ